MRIFIASSWDNEIQPALVNVLRRLGHVVYDFRNPEVGTSGFNWREIEPRHDVWSPTEYRDALQKDTSRAAYKRNVAAIKECNACVLALPAGRSASWELGYAMGLGKIGIVAQFEKAQPELMYSDAEVVTSTEELVEAIKRHVFT